MDLPNKSPCSYQFINRLSRYPIRLRQLSHLFSLPQPFLKFIHLFFCQRGRTSALGVGISFFSKGDSFTLAFTDEVAFKTGNCAEYLKLETLEGIIAFGMENHAFLLEVERYAFFAE